MRHAVRWFGAMGLAAAMATASGAGEVRSAHRPILYLRGEP